jgi:hypothetical protein
MLTLYVLVDFTAQPVPQRSPTSYFLWIWQSQLPLPPSYIASLVDLNVQTDLPLSCTTTSVLAGSQWQCILIGIMWYRKPVRSLHIQSFSYQKKSILEQFGLSFSPVAMLFKMFCDGLKKTSRNQAVIIYHNYLYSVRSLIMCWHFGVRYDKIDHICMLLAI